MEGAVIVGSAKLFHEQGMEDMIEIATENAERFES